MEASSDEGDNTLPREVSDLDAMKKFGNSSI